MKTVLICGIFAAGLIGVLALEEYYQPEASTRSQYTESSTDYDISTLYERSTTESELITKTDVTLTQSTYEEPSTTPVAFINYNQPYQTYQAYQSYKPSYFGVPYEEHEPCSHEISDEVFQGYRNAVYNISAKLYKRVSALTNTHFVFSPQTTFLTLAAMAEGSSGPTRQQLFKFLSLPEDICLREAYYHLATSREQKGTDIVFARNRLFVADSSIHVNKKWEEYVKNYAHLNTISVPYKSNPVVEVASLKKLFNVELPHLDLSGNSLLLESLDYAALWTSVFSDAIIQPGPFYNSFGEQIGVVDYMTVNRRASIGFMPRLNLKVIDLPIGREGRYRMYIAVSLAAHESYEDLVNRINNEIIFEALENLKPSLEPVQIVLPKINITSELDMRKLLEDVGIRSLWTDPSATRNISQPAALPSAFTQRVTVHLDNGDVRPAIPEYKNFVPPLHHTHSGGYVKPGYTTQSPLWAQYNPLELASFVANKPFMFGVFDAQSYTGHVYGSYSHVL